MTREETINNLRRLRSQRETATAMVREFAAAVDAGHATTMELAAMQHQLDAIDLALAVVRRHECERRGVVA